VAGRKGEDEMTTQRIGGTGPAFGTIDETYGIFENVELTTDVEETELLDGDSDVYAVDQHTKRLRISGEYTYKAVGGVADTDVGSGSLVTINASDTDVNQTAYIRSYSSVKTKGDYRKIRFEGTSWPALGS
jgi:hypothetical protein